MATITARSQHSDPIPDSPGAGRPPGVPTFPAAQQVAPGTAQTLGPHRLKRSATLPRCASWSTASSNAVQLTLDLREDLIRVGPLFASKSLPVFSDQTDGAVSSAAW
jgi:hypothetical protein